MHQHPLPRDAKKSNEIVPTTYSGYGGRALPNRHTLWRGSNYKVKGKGAQYIILGMLLCFARLYISLEAENALSGREPHGVTERGPAFCSDEGPATETSLS